jgi:hypothetical protein
LASLRRESSNQLLDTLKEWSNYPERHAPIIRVGKVGLIRKHELARRRIRLSHTGDISDRAKQII